jgi:hypothetical protein
MSKAMTAVSMIAFAALSVSPQALGQTSQVFGADDIARIAQTSRDNAARFNRDFRGKSFKAKLPVRSISENFLISDRYTATFGNNPFGGNVTCDVKDRPTINLMMDWDRGQIVTISGTIRSTMMGDIRLDDCRYVPHPGEKR